MAFSDYTFAGLKARIAFRLENQPVYTDEILGVALNKAILDLILFCRIKTEIYTATSFILPSGPFAGLYAAEYTLPSNTLWVDDFTFDFVPCDIASLHEMAWTGLGQKNLSTGTPRWYCIRDEPGGGKTVMLFPRPNRAAQLLVMGGTAPAALVNASDVPPLQSAFGLALEYYGAWYCLDGQPGEEAKAELMRNRYKAERAEVKVNLGIDRRMKQRRTRDFPT